MEKVKYLKICVSHGRYEESCYCKDLDEVAAALDDFSTDHCEGVCQLYMKHDGSGQFVPVNIWTEFEDLFENTFRGVD